MTVRCNNCGSIYNDADCWTICPHGPLWAAPDAYCKEHDLVNCKLHPKSLSRRILKALNICPMFQGGKSWRWGRSDEPRLWMHRSNENELPAGRHGCILRNGRAWIHFGDNCFGWQWVLGQWGLAAMTTVDLYGGEHELSGHVYVPGVRFYWHIDRVLPRRFRNRVGEWWRRTLGYDGRDLGFDCHNGALWVKLWAPENGWDSRNPRWMDWNFNPANFFLGRHTYSCRTLGVEETVVPLPEGVYPARIEFEEATWKRPRWPFVKRRLGAHITLHKPAPVPGKGENSWDCDDDAIYSLSCGAQTTEDAVAAVVRSVLRDRRRHGGGVDWRPAGR